MPADLVHASQESHEFEARRHRLESGKLFFGVGKNEESWNKSFLLHFKLL